MRIFGGIAAWLLAIVLMGGGLAAAEFYARSAQLNSYIARRPADISTEAAYVAKLEAFASRPAPKTIVLGDSVGLGQVMSGKGISNWRDLELSSALGRELGAIGSSIEVANFSANGLRPADFAQTMLDAANAGTGVVVLVLSLRGFSFDFEEGAERYTHPWRAKTLDLATPFAGEVRGRSLSHWWRTRGVADFLVLDRTGGSLPTAFARLRQASHAGDAKSGATSGDGIGVLRMRQRMASVNFDPAQRFQARRLLEALKALDARGVRVIVVYASENTESVSSMMTTAMAERNRAGLEALVRSAGQRLIYLGPDPAMTPDLYIDEMHPNPAGYAMMARRIAPVLAQLLK